MTDTWKPAKRPLVMSAVANKTTNRPHSSWTSSDFYKKKTHHRVFLLLHRQHIPQIQGVQAVNYKLPTKSKGLPSFRKTTRQKAGVAQ